MAKQIQKSIFSIYLTGVVLAICLYFAMKPTEKVADNEQENTIAHPNKLAKTENNKLQEPPSNPSLSSKKRGWGQPLLLGIISWAMTCAIVVALLYKYIEERRFKARAKRNQEIADELKNEQPAEGKEKAYVDNIIRVCGLTASCFYYAAEYGVRAYDSVYELLTAKSNVDIPFQVANVNLKIGEELIKRCLQDGCIKATYDTTTKNAGESNIVKYEVWLSEHHFLCIVDMRNAIRLYKEACYAREEFSMFFLDGYCRQYRKGSLLIPTDCLKVIKNYTEQVRYFSQDYPSKISVVCHRSVINRQGAGKYEFRKKDWHNNVEITLHSAAYTDVVRKLSGEDTAP